MVGLVSIGTGVVGVVAAIGALRAGARRPGRKMAVARIAFGVAFLLRLMTAGLDSVATS